MLCQIAGLVQQSEGDIDAKLLEAEWIPKTHSKQVACTISVFCEAIMSNDLLLDYVQADSGAAFFAPSLNFLEEQAGL